MFMCCKLMLWIILGSLFSQLYTNSKSRCSNFPLAGVTWPPQRATQQGCVSTNKNPLCLKMCFCTGSNLNLDTAKQLSVFPDILSRLNEADLFPPAGAGHVLRTHLRHWTTYQVSSENNDGNLTFSSLHCLEYATGTSSRWSFSPVVYRVVS